MRSCALHATLKSDTVDDEAATGRARQLLQLRRQFAARVTHSGSERGIITAPAQPGIEPVVGMLSGLQLQGSGSPRAPNPRTDHGRHREQGPPGRARLNPEEMQATAKPPTVLEQSLAIADAVWTRYEQLQQYLPDAEAHSAHQDYDAGDDARVPDWRLEQRAHLQAERLARMSSGRRQRHSLRERRRRAEAHRIEQLIAAMQSDI